jgi:hypothetical protein
MKNNLRNRSTKMDNTLIEVTEGTIPKYLDFSSHLFDPVVNAKITNIWPKGYGFIGQDKTGSAYFQKIRNHSTSCPCGRCPTTEVDGPTVGKVALP